MTVRSVLTLLEGSDRDTIDLEAAKHLAKDFGCHIDLLHVRRDGLSALPMVGEGMSGDLIEMVQAQVEKEEQEIAEKCQAVFGQWMKDNGIAKATGASPDTKASASLIDMTGQAGDLVARLGKLADLVLLRSPSVNDDGLSAAAEAAIYDTGKPVLFSPREHLESLGTRIAIFWNDTAEASRAAAAALPFLKRADAVQVIAIDDDSVDSEAIQAFAKSLAWHGIDAKTELLAPDHRPVGEALLDTAWDFKADLIVMGAYSHSRLRQMILGGVTRHMLQVAGRPVLMMH